MAKKTEKKPEQALVREQAPLVLCRLVAGGMPIKDARKKLGLDNPAPEKPVEKSAEEVNDESQDLL